MSAPRIIDGMPAAEYHALPMLSASGCVELETGCPASFWFNSPHNPARPIDEPSNDMDFGSAMHVAVLEPALWSEKVNICQFKDWKKAAAQDERDNCRAHNVIPILPRQAECISAMTTALAKHPIAAQAFTGGKTEQTTIWQHPQFGFMCKARPDFTPDDLRYLSDYKTVTNAHPLAFERHAFDMGYHQAAAWYLDGLEAATGKQVHEYWFVCQEREAPYLISVCRLGRDAIDWGRKLNLKAAATYARCLEKNEWPGYRPFNHPDQDRAFDIGLPGYAAFQLADRDMAGEFNIKLPTQADLRRAALAQRPLEQGEPA